MEAKELMKAGQLAEARKVLVDAVKNSPADMSSRTLLFQVLSYLGEWEKADRHLETIGLQDSSRETGVLGCRNLVHAEKERQTVTDENTPASFLTDPPAYLDLFMSGRDKLSKGKIEEAADLFNRTQELRPDISGTVNAKEFSGLTDTDIFLFPFLEVIAHERYLWIPFESLRELTLSPPENLLDLLWITAKVTTWEGFAMNCYLPVLYPNSFLHDDERIKMGRMTDWSDAGGGFSKGIGQHVFAVGGEDMSLLEISEMTFNFPGSDESDE